MLELRRIDELGDAFDRGLFPRTCSDDREAFLFRLPLRDPGREFGIQFRVAEVLVVKGRGVGKVHGEGLEADGDDVRSEVFGRLSCIRIARERINRGTFGVEATDGEDAGEQETSRWLHNS